MHSTLDSPQHLQDRFLESIREGDCIEGQPEELKAKISYASSSKEVATKMRGREDMEIRQKLHQLDRCENVWMKMGSVG